jgi:hypothetical protein
MLAELAALPVMQAWPVAVLDIDTDSTARSRYGHKIPVLLFDGEVVCHGRLDAEEVRKTLALCG